MLTTEEEQRFLALRQEIIKFRYRDLNPPQQLGVMTTQGQVLLLAGAGSGKTTVLIERIANLLSFGEASDSNEIPPHITSADLAILEGYVVGEPTFEEDIQRICTVNPVKPWNILAITFTNKIEHAGSTVSCLFCVFFLYNNGKLRLHRKSTSGIKLPM